MKPPDKVCSRCNEFKSLSEFYKQGNRHESLCKECKKNSRSKREKTVCPSPLLNTETSATAERFQKNHHISQDDGREIMPRFDESIFYPQEERRSLGISDDDMDSIVAYFRWQMDQREKRLKKKEEEEL